MSATARLGSRRRSTKLVDLCDSHGKTEAFQAAAWIYKLLRNYLDFLLRQ